MEELHLLFVDKGCGTCPEKAEPQPEDIYIDRAKTI